MAKGKNLSRSGKKHKKVATHDIHRQPKAEPVLGDTPAASSAVERLAAARACAESLLAQHDEQAQEPAWMEVDELVPLLERAAVAVDTDGGNEAPAASDSEPPGPAGPPASLNTSLPGFCFRGTAGAFEDEGWDLYQPPCIPSDERPEHVFGSMAAAKAIAAANILDNLNNICPPTSDSEEEGDAEREEREDREEVARAQYKLAIRKLARAFPDLDIPAAGLTAGLHAREQETRSCPCGAGLLPRWPWVPVDARLGFCPGAVIGEKPNSYSCGKHSLGNHLLAQRVD